MKLAIAAFTFVLGACSGGADGTPTVPSADDPRSDAGTAAQADTCASGGSYELCKTASGADGARQCETSTQGDVWSDCLPTTACQPGQSQDCFAPGSPYYGLSKSCRLISGQWQYDSSGCNTPLVLAFEDEPVSFTNPLGAFDLAGRETLVRTDWVSSATPWLVFDRNANGTIDDGSELFGSMTRLPDGNRAKNGFLALAPLDADGDGWLTAKDPGFARLALWRDLNQDRLSSANELTPLGESVVALSLDYADVPRCSGGSCERERSTLVFRGRDGGERRGSVVDVYLGEP